MVVSDFTSLMFCDTLSLLQPDNVCGLVLMRLPTAWEEREGRRGELEEAARYEGLKSAGKDGTGWVCTCSQHAV